MFSGTNNLNGVEVHNINRGVQGNHNKISIYNYGSSGDRDALKQLADAACLTAIFNAESDRQRSKCLAGTRIEVLSKLRGIVGIELANEERGSIQFGGQTREKSSSAPLTGYLESAQYPNDGADGENSTRRRICWVSGKAGMGKSAIANTLADEWKESGRLAGTFYFSREDTNRTHTSALFPTLAYQLALLNDLPILRSILLEAIMNDPTLLKREKSRKDQLKELICAALSALGVQCSYPMVFVIDALDECRSGDAEQLVLLLAGELEANNLPNLSIFVTSRPESNLTYVLKTLCDRGLAAHISLEHEHETAERDIRYFFRTEFEHVYQRRLAVLGHIPPPWPGDSDIDSLVKLANEVFIVAATIIRHVGDPRQDPQDRLEDILNSGLGDQADINRIYRHVLSSSPDPALSSFFLGVITNLATPLCRRDIEILLGTKSKGLGLMLEACPSILHIPSLSSAEPIRIWHSSLRDFLVDAGRAAEYYADPLSSHKQMAISCLRLIKEKCTRNMLGLDDPFAAHSDTTDFSRKRDSFFTGSLRYACSHWGYHVGSASCDDILWSAVQEFATTKLLFWIEAMSLLGKLGDAVSVMHDIQEKFKRDLPPRIPPKRSQDVLVLFYDAERFILEFMDCIGSSALLIYHNTRSFMPSAVLLREVYERDLNISSHVLLSVTHGLQKEWDSCLRTITFATEVGGLAMSADGTLLASSTTIDDVQLWDMMSGVKITTLDGSGKFGIDDMLRFSPDGKFLVVGRNTDERGRFQIWDVKLNRLILEQETDDEFYSFEFSPTGRRYVRTGKDTIAVWDLSNWSCETLDHEDVIGARFSFDDNRFVSWSRSASTESPVILWDVVDGHWRHSKVTLALGCALKEVIWAHNGNWIAGLSDEYFRAVDAVTGEVLVEKYSQWMPNALFHFTVDDNRLIYADNGFHSVAVGDDTKGDQDDATADLNVVFAGETRIGVKMNGQFYPYEGYGSHASDGQGYLAAVASENTIKLWKTVLRNPDQPLCVADFIESRDENRIAVWTDEACSPDSQKVVVVDVSGREIYTTPEFRNTFLYDDPVFSPDGSILAYADKIRKGIALLDGRTGHERVFLQFEAVKSLAVSNTHIAILYNSEIISLYEFADGHCIHFETSGKSFTLSFSCDGAFLESCGKGIRVWNIYTHDLIYQKDGHIEVIQFSPVFPSLLFSAREDGSVSLHDVESGSTQELISVPVRIEQLAVSQDGSNVGAWGRGQECLVDITYPDVSRATNIVAEIKARLRTPTGFDEMGFQDIVTFSPYRISSDGWLYHGTKKACWIPARYRPSDPAHLRANNKEVCIITRDGSLVISQFKNAPWLSLAESDMDLAGTVPGYLHSGSADGSTALQRLNRNLGSKNQDTSLPLNSLIHVSPLEDMNASQEPSAESSSRRRPRQHRTFRRWMKDFLDKFD